MCLFCLLPANFVVRSGPASPRLTAARARQRSTWTVEHRYGTYQIHRYGTCVSHQPWDKERPQKNPQSYLGSVPPSWMIHFACLCSTRTAQEGPCSSSSCRGSCQSRQRPSPRPRPPSPPRPAHGSGTWVPGTASGTASTTSASSLAQRTSSSFCIPEQAKAASGGGGGSSDGRLRGIDIWDLAKQILQC